MPLIVVLNLHSNMDRLKRAEKSMIGYAYLDLHSNMDRLKQDDKRQVYMSGTIYIPIWID